MIKIFKTNKKYLLLVIIICLLLSINVEAIDYKNVKVSEKYLQKLEKVHVEKVIDGDTIVIENGETIRFIGVDTPEYEESFYAKTATAFTKNKLLNRDVYIELDKDKFDKHGRILAYIYTEEGKFFNALLLQKGRAMLLSVPPNTKYMKIMQEMAKQARDNESGLWEDLPILSWKNAGDYQGKLAIIRGKIIATYDSGKATFLNFDKEYWHTFSAVIFNNNMYRFNFSPAEYYLEKRVRIMGKIKIYKNSHEIIVRSPAQIKVLP